MIQELFYFGQKSGKAAQGYCNVSGTKLSSLDQGDGSGNDDGRVRLRGFLKRKIINSATNF